MSRYLKVKGQPDFVKDVSTNALLNKNNNALQAYKNTKAQSRRMNELEEKVDDLSSDIKEIKEMLMGLTRNG